MEETALAFTDFASYYLTNIFPLQNFLTFPWLLLIFQFSPISFKIPWLFPDRGNPIDGCPGKTRRARVTLTFDLPEWNLQLAHLLIKENSCATLFLNS